MQKYILVENRTTLLLGPFYWNKYRRFQTELEELEIDFILSPTEHGYIKINDNYEIFPLVSIDGPEINILFERPVGPFYEYSQEEARAVFKKEDLPIHEIRDKLKEAAANIRYNNEIAGILVTVGNKQYRVETTREMRFQFLHKLMYWKKDSTLNWKFDKQFVALRKHDLDNIVNTIDKYIQAQFDWEKKIWDEIDDASTIEEIKEIKIS